MILKQFFLAEKIWANVVNTLEPENKRDGEQLWIHTHWQWEIFRTDPRLLGITLSPCQIDCSV